LGLDFLKSNKNVALKLLFAVASTKLPEGGLHLLEGLALLAYNITLQTTTNGIIGVIAQWAHGHLTESLCKHAYAIVKNLTGAGTCTEQSNATPDWLDCLRDARTNWALCKSNRAFKQLSKLIGVCVSMGLCQASNLTFNIGTYNLYTPEICDRHMSTFDMFDAVFDTLSFFIEGFYLCFTTGSLRPLLLNDRTALELDTEYAQVQAWYSLATNGNLYKFARVTDHDFEKRMNRLAVSLNTLAQSLKAPEKNIVIQRYQNILTMQNDFVAAKISSGIRHAPWAFTLFGESCQGKTTCGDQLTEALLISQGMDPDKSRRCAYNAGDKFMSNWTSDKLVMIFDDLGNDKSDFVEKAPTRSLLDVINNQMFYAPKAELTAKGKCFVEPWIVYATTNVKDLGARVYSECPFSIQRRLYSITVKARPELQRNTDGINCGLDPALVERMYIDKGGTKPGIEDLWLLTVEHAVQPHDLSNAGSYVPVVYEGTPLVDVPMARVVQWATQSFADHVRRQRVMLDDANSRKHKVKKCSVEGCTHINGMCPHHAATPDPVPDTESDATADFTDEAMSLSKFKKLTKRDITAWYQWFTDASSDNTQNDGADPHQLLLRDEDLTTAVKPDETQDSNDYARWLRECRTGCAEVWHNHYSKEKQEEALDNQLGMANTVSAVMDVLSGSGFIYDSFERVNKRADEMVAETIYKEAKKFFDAYHYIQLLPSSFFLRPDAKSYLAWFFVDRIDKNYEGMARQRWAHLAAFNVITTICYVGSLWCVPTISFPQFMFYLFSAMLATFTISLFITLSVIKDLRDKAEDDFVEEMIALNLNVYPMFKDMRDKYVENFGKLLAGAAFLYTARKVYREYFQDQDPVDVQGSLEPADEQEVIQRDSEVNPWGAVVARSLPIGTKSKRMSPEHLDNCVQKALVYGTILHPDGNGIMNCVFLRSNVLLVPDHYFVCFGDELNCEFRKCNPETCGGRFTASLHISKSHLIPGTDLRLCYIYSGGTYKNIIEYFPLTEMPRVPFRMHWRKKDGSFITAKGMTIPGYATTSGRTLAGEARPDKRFIGGHYDRLTIDTFGGLCGATLVSETNGCTIIGVHLGGEAGTPVGCYGSLTREKIETGVLELRKCTGVILTGDESAFRPEVLGIQVMKPDPLHVKSPIRYMPHQSQIQYFGSCIGRTVSTTGVVTTPISQYLDNVCGSKNIYHGPKFKPDWSGWQTCLQNMSHPAKEFPAPLLDVAIKDYIEPLLVRIRDPKLKWNEARPLNDVENLNGIDGIRFIDSIKLGTAIGFPLTGPKRDRVIEVTPEDGSKPYRVLDSALLEEIATVEALYAEGLRAFLIAKACKKDEIVSSEKCRIFFSNPLALTFLIRKYYLPILRFLQMNPLLAECAVGINSHGPEWEVLHKFIFKFGEERLYGGDYGKYDQKLSSQLIISSLRILIDLARECNYTEADLAIMEAMTADIVYAYIAFNGDLVGLTSGTHISGNSLTVIVNGICGSLNLRCYFYTLYKPASFEDRMKFRDYVSLITYGDDNIGTVHPDAWLFTIKGCSLFLFEYGQIYTMPDKSSELQDYLPNGGFEFLKRSSMFHDALGVHVGALAEKSIFKSLHCYIREQNSPNLPGYACALNIDGAMREWFNHGPQVYEKRRMEMQQVADLAGIRHQCSGLDSTYDDRVRDWYATYYPEPTVTPET
jgi:hypothetical protein